MCQSADQNAAPPFEISDPACECAGVQFLTVDSPSLGGRGDISVFSPAETDSLSSVPVVLLLHGVYSSHWAWFLKGNAHRTARNLIAAGKIRPMLLVAPSDGLFQQGSGYLRHSGHDYEAWIVSDVLNQIPKAFRCVDRNSLFFLAGLSMGGYGALRLGAKHAPLFRGISAHSPITTIIELQRFLRNPFPTDQISAAEGDLMHWFTINRCLLPPMRLDCGAEDPLLEGNRHFHHELERRHIPHRYVEFPGGHDWYYWSAHVGDSLVFFEELLAASSST
jgi:enterochelin esterase-like enzyme